MTPFHSLSAIAAPMPEADIDTDVIFPARFLLLTEKHGLARCAFHEKRYMPQGIERPEFVLNREPWRRAEILVTGANFGCGSSREQAPWALADLGLRCIIAPGFGEIFRANCFANGLLAIVLDRRDHARVMCEAEAGRPLCVDLMGCTIEWSGGGDETGEPILFEIPNRHRDALLAGLDEIGMIQRHEMPKIAAFERRHHQGMPWLAPQPGSTQPL